MAVSENDKGICLRLDETKVKKYERMIAIFTAWRQEKAKLESGEITKEEYDKWRYKYPEFDTTQRWTKVPSQGLSDWLVKELNKE